MLCIVFFCLLVNPSIVDAKDDVITLNSGEEVTGRIISENNTQLLIEVSNARKTIFNTKAISKSQIKSTERETVASKTERLDYETIKSYRLVPDQEFTVQQCDATIAICHKYLETYPNSEYAAAVRLQINEFENEKQQVEAGMVKFDNQWMAVSQKALQKELRSSFEKVEQIQRTLDALEKQEETSLYIIANEMGASKGGKSTPDSTGNVERDRALLDIVKSKIKRTQSDLDTARQNYLSIKAKIGGKGTSPPVAAAPPPPLPPPPTPWEQYWPIFVGVALVVLWILSRLFR